MVYILLADGFEEMEALVPADLLRRAGVRVSLVGLDALEVTGGHGITVKADLVLEQIDQEAMQMLVLPGGMGGVESLQMNLFATENILPNRTVFFDIKPEAGLQRVYANKEREVNRLDLENIDFHERVYEGYLTICNRFPERIVKVDASQDIEDVLFQVLEKIREIL